MGFVSVCVYCFFRSANRLTKPISMAMTTAAIMAVNIIVLSAGGGISIGASAVGAGPTDAAVDTAELP